jgi:2-desacetyl-2-hydroxyethyl bacteriochlorophyllide A dehydrogenase
MRAIVYEGAANITVREMQDPPVPEGWALIKVSHAGICGTDLNIYQGTHPRAKAPLVMGHEFSGMLMRDIPQAKKGDLVTVYPLLSCGTCQPCLTGNAHVCNTLGLLGIDRDGAMAEYTVAPIDTIIPLPGTCDAELGALIEPIAVGVHTLRETGFVSGDNAVVYGCGTIGLVMAIMLQQFGSSAVYMVEVDQARSALARELGFEVWDPSQDDIEAKGKSVTGGNGFDWVFDCAGSQSVADTLFDMVCVKGHIVIVASYKKAAALPLIKGMFKETSIQFVRVYRKKDFEVAALIADREPRYRKLITHVLPYEEAQAGFDHLLLKGSGAVKVMFRF